MLTTIKGIIRPGPIVNMVGPIGAANSVLVYTVPVLVGQLIGVKSVKVRKVIMHNNAAGNTTVILGNGAVGVGIPAILPALDSFNGLTDSYVCDVDFPEVESFANIVAWMTALAVGGTIDIQLECEIIG